VAQKEEIPRSKMEKESFFFVISSSVRTKEKKRNLENVIIPYRREGALLTLGYE
tara:strand:- start:607 stop:768 length:162 start_codon:yes stop_codon:yes gene_type:complete